MATFAAGEITRLLKDMRDGDPQSRPQFVALVYDQLYGMARRATGRQTQHTLNPTALVNEVFFKLMKTDTIASATDRRYFFAAAAQAMRQILADHARKKNAAKRGGRQVRVVLDLVVEYLQCQNIDTLALTEALEELEQRDPRKAQVVQLRFFGGCTMAEIAEHLEISLGTVELDWRAARAFLYHRLR